MVEDKESDREFGAKIAEQVLEYLESNFEETAKSNPLRMSVYSGAVLQAVLHFIHAVSPTQQIAWTMIHQSIAHIYTIQLSKEAEVFMNDVERRLTDEKEDEIVH